MSASGGIARRRGVVGRIGVLVVVAMIQAELDAANEKYARVEQIKRFKILDRDFTLDSGELTPSLKLKRNVVYERCADDFAALYDM